MRFPGRVDSPTTRQRQAGYRVAASGLAAVPAGLSRARCLRGKFFAGVSAIPCGQPFTGPSTVGGGCWNRYMTAIANHPHRVTTAIAGVRCELSSVAAAAVWSMDAAETTAALVEIRSAKAQLAELEARLLCHADRLEVAGSTAASSTANWHAVATATTRLAAHRMMRTAHGLDRHEPTRAALARGALNLEQAEAILRALAELPDDLDPDIAGRAEARLLDLAHDHDAHALRVLGRRILEVVPPEPADAHEAKLLEQEERAAAAATRLTLWDDGHGRVHGRFTLDTPTGAALTKALWAIAAPKHQAAQGTLRERRPTPERLGRAFVD